MGLELSGERQCDPEFEIQNFDQSTSPDMKHFSHNSNILLMLLYIPIDLNCIGSHNFNIISSQIFKICEHILVHVGSPFDSQLC